MGTGWVDAARSTFADRAAIADADKHMTETGEVFRETGGEIYLSAG